MRNIFLLIFPLDGITECIIGFHGVIDFEFRGTFAVVFFDLFIVVNSDIILMEVLNCDDLSIYDFCIRTNIVEFLIEDVFPVSAAWGAIIDDQFHYWSQSMFSTFNHKITRNVLSRHSIGFTTSFVYPLSTSRTIWRVMSSHTSLYHICCVILSSQAESFVEF